jgi:hypothetical protein
VLAAILLGIEMNYIMRRSVGVGVLGTRRRGRQTTVK